MKKNGLCVCLCQVKGHRSKVKSKKHGLRIGQNLVRLAMVLPE